MLENEFGMFDAVKLVDDFEGLDIYENYLSLKKGSSGSVLELGEEPGTLIVEFHIGKSMKSVDYTSVELDAEFLEVVSKIGRRFSESLRLK